MFCTNMATKKLGCKTEIKDLAGNMAILNKMGIFFSFFQWCIIMDVKTNWEDVSFNDKLMD